MADQCPLCSLWKGPARPTAVPNYSPPSAGEHIGLPHVLHGENYPECVQAGLQERDRAEPRSPLSPRLLWDRAGGRVRGGASAEALHGEPCKKMVSNVIISAKREVLGEDVWILWGKQKLWQITYVCLRSLPSQGKVDIGPQVVSLLSCHFLPSRLTRCQHLGWDLQFYALCKFSVSFFCF